MQCVAVPERKARAFDTLLSDHGDIGLSVAIDGF